MDIHTSIRFFFTALIFVVIMIGFVALKNWRKKK